MVSPSTPEHIQTFASARSQALDVHAPLQICLAMLAENGLQMHFPDRDIRDFAPLKQWYDRLTHLFFNE